MEHRKTKKEFFNELYSFVENSNIVDKVEMLGFIDHEIELLEKKSSSKAMTKTQKENIGIKDLIVDVLTDNGEAISISDMLKDERLKGYTNQKISALIKQLANDGVVVRVEDKKKALFKLA